MRIANVLVAVVIVSALTGCPSQRQSHQVAQGPTGVAHITGAPVESAAVAEEPCAPASAPCAPAAVPAPQETAEVVEPEPAPVVEPVKMAPVPTTGPAFGNAPDYSWLIGRLRRVHVPGGEWKIRYAPLDVVDEWGGSMVLAPDIRLDQFSDGDFIYIEGEILVERPSLYLAGPLYRVRTMRDVTVQDRIRLAKQRSSVTR